MTHSIAADVNLPPIMRELLDRYHSHDAPRLAELYLGDCRFSFPGIEAQGREEIEGIWSAWFKAFPDVESDILRAP